MSAAVASRPRWAALGLGGLALLTVVTVGMGEGDVLVGLLPLLALGFLWAVRRLPTHQTAVGLFALILCVDNPYEIPFAGMWESPLTPFSRLLYHNLKKVTGVQALRFSLLMVLMVGLLLWAAHQRARRGVGLQGVLPRCLSQALWLWFATILILEVVGVARGGDVQESFWQMQCLLFLPVLAGIWHFALRGPEDLRLVGGATLASGVFKTLLGAYFLYAVARPKGIEPPYVTQHTDSMLFVIGIITAVALWMEQPSSRHALLCFTLVPVLLFGLVINDRRLAYVSLAESLVVVFALSPWSRSKRFVARTALVLAPLLLIYGVVGWTKHSPIFKPVQVMRSVVAPDPASEDQEVADSSTEFRHMENFDLVMTWKARPLMGSGFGHPYDEVIKLPDISHYFPEYRFVPHNSILWLWGVGGLFGFSALWLAFGVFLMLAARAYRSGRDPTVRAAAMVCICTGVCFVNQCFGDMGTQSWVSMALLAPAMVIAGRLAIATGAWPAAAGAAS